MAQRRTDRHQLFDQAGTLVEETVADEPLSEFNERELRERLESAIQAETADIARIDQITAAWSGLTTAQRFGAVVELFGMMRLEKRITRGELRLILGRLDELEAE